jgi:hypothetical protein
MFSRPQQRPSHLIDTVLDGAKSVKSMTENVALLNPLNVSVNTVIAILESIRVNTNVFYGNLGLTLFPGCEIESRGMVQSRQDFIGRYSKSTEDARRMPDSAFDNTITYSYVI